MYERGTKIKKKIVTLLSIIVPSVYLSNFGSYGYNTRIDMFRLRAIQIKLYNIHSLKHNIHFVKQQWLY